MNTLYMVRDDGSDLTKFINVLRGDRLIRFNNAKTNHGKRKLIMSTILHCYVLIQNGIPLDEIKKMISKRQISNSVRNYSNSSSNLLFIEMYSSNTNSSISVDTEKIVNRSNEIYQLFFKNHDLKRDLTNKLQDDFYINWIKYELGIKLAKESTNESFHFIKVKDYYIGSNVSPDKLEIVKLNDIFNIVRRCHLI